MTNPQLLRDELKESVNFHYTTDKCCDNCKYKYDCVLSTDDENGTCDIWTKKEEEKK